MKIYLKIISIIFITLLSNKAIAITLDEAIDLGLTNSKEYKIEKYYLKSAENNKRAGMSEFLPEVSLSYQTGKKQNIRSDGAGTDDFLTEKTNTLSVTQPVFNGMRGISTLKQGSAEYLAQKFKLEDFKRELILRIATNYLETRRLEKTLKLTKDNVEYYRRILSRTKSKGSLTSENEIIDNKIGYYNAKRNLEEAENKLQQARFEYENLIGVKPENLEDTKKEMLALSLEDLLKDKSLNPALMQKHYEVAALKQAYKKEVGSLAPKVNISANYSKQENLVYLDGGNLESKSIMLDVTIPLFQKGSEYFGIKKAKYDLKIKKEEFQLTSLEVEKKINQSFKEYDYSKKSYDQISNIFSLAKRKLARNNKSYNLRALSLISLLKIRIERNESEIKFHEAKANLYAAYYKLKLLTKDINRADGNE